MDRTHLIAGAYPAVPPADPWSRHDEERFWSRLTEGAGEVGLGGLELPWLDGSVHAYDEEWYLGRLPPSWVHVVTMIPDTMKTASADPTCGLASLDEAGRRRAVDRARSLRDHLETLAQQRGGPFARSVEVHSAPRRATLDDPEGGSGEAFVRSLTELGAWDWSGAGLVVEHCDATRPGRDSAKGFLSIAAEIAAVRSLPGGLPTPVSVGVNWGRSVIEGHDRGTAVEHVRAAAGEGRLSTLLFSGAAQGAAVDTWADVHLPPDTVDAASLLRAADIADCLAAAGGPGSVPTLGVKVRAAPGPRTPEQRADDVVRSVVVVVEASTGR